MAKRSFWAWGLESEEPTSEQLHGAAAEVSRRYGLVVEPLPAPKAADLNLRKPRISAPSALAAICSTDDHDRAVHTYGRSFRDRIRAFNLQFPNPGKAKLSWYRQLASFTSDLKTRSLNFVCLHSPTQCSGSTNVYSVIRVFPSLSICMRSIIFS